MTTIDASPLAEALQSLIDARLDTIDRMLVGRVNRQDRLSIVREVESQVFDLLQGRDPGSLDRDDVLAVLARLDPPEAYLPEEGATSEPRPAHASMTAPTTHGPGRKAGAGRINLASGILGLCSLAFVLLLTMMELASGFLEIILYAGMGLSFIACLLAIIFAAQVKLRGGWAIVGLVTGILSLLAYVGIGILLLSQK